MYLCRELLAANPQVVADLKAGNQKAVGALIGQAKAQNPNVNPAEIRQICLTLVTGARSFRSCSYGASGCKQMA